MSATTHTNPDAVKSSPTPLPSFVTPAMYAWLFLLRQDMKFGKFNLRQLRSRNEKSNSPVTAVGGPVVSLTTFGARLQSVFLTIESIGRGALLPSRLILWLQDPQSYQERPDSLKRLEARGLEVRLTESFGSHSKYYPYLESTDGFHLPLVTADDDVFYSKWWLAGLFDAYRNNPRQIHCYRAHFMKFTNGAINPYLKWATRQSTEPSSRCFATGVSGVIYPPQYLQRLKIMGRQFLDTCPKADDVWFHVNALRAGYEVRQIGSRPVDFPTIPGTQAAGLFQSNWNSGGNDEQIKDTYKEADLAVLRPRGA